jgi:hypothetical protein
MQCSMQMQCTLTEAQLSEVKMWTVEEYCRLGEGRRSRKTRHKQDEVGREAEAMVGFHLYNSLHGPALALYDWSGQPIVRQAAGHNQ